MELEGEQEQRQLVPERGTQGTERARRRSSLRNRCRTVHMGMALVTKIEAKIWQEEAKEQVTDLLL
jgi:hypothetical protein